MQAAAPSLLRRGDLKTSEGAIQSLRLPEAQEGKLPGSDEVTSHAPQDGRPHVLLVVDQFPEALGGGERIVLRLAALLPQYGYTVSILTLSVHPKSSVLTARAPCPIYLLPLQRTYDWKAIRSALALGNFIRRQRIGIVQTFFESSDIWAGTATRLLTSARLIWSRRDMGILRTGKHRLAYRILARMPDRVFAVSEQVRQYCIETDRIQADRVRTIYNGLDVPEAAARKKRTEGLPVLLTIGNIRQVKGHDVLIRAAGLLAPEFPRFKLQIVGGVLEPAYFQELENLVRELQLSEHVEFTGGLDDLAGVLRDADLFVLPSRSEGFSNVIVEAMAASLPVVAMDVGGNAEAVADGVTGLIVPPDDVPALAEAMARLLTKPDEAARMGAAGRERASAHFTTEAMMTGIVSTYAELLKKR